MVKQAFSRLTKALNGHFSPFVEDAEHNEPFASRYDEFA